MSDADLLRQAAALMREQHGPEHPRHPMWVAMAALLEHRASVWLDDIPVSHDPYAGAVARAFLGESDV